MISLLSNLSRIPRRTLSTLPLAHLSLAPTALTVSINNTPTTFPYLWLRDACYAPASVHPSTRQKLFRTSDIPQTIKPAHDGVHLDASNGTIAIRWEDGHQSTFDAAFLARHANPASLAKFHHDDVFAQHPWTRDTLPAHDLFVDYSDLRSPPRLAQTITQLARSGLLFVRGVPNRETGDTKCELRTLARTFGEIRPTFYGETWDVVNVKESKNIAYTNLDLGLHMDLLYFQHPPRYQILHCLRNRVEGGTSIFVDALHAATVLRDTHPDHFATLATTPVSFHYINDGHHLHFEHPTIELDPLNRDRISHINYSPPFQAPLPLNTPEEFYPALRAFTQLLNDPANTYEYTLKEGDAVLFDNRRVLHARTAFWDREGEKEAEGETNRWLKGCYLEADAIMDRGRMLLPK